MDAVKQGRVKVKKGDCVSVPSNYFGASFEVQLKNLGFKDGRIYGRVIKVIDGNRNFAVEWDYDQQISNFMSMDKVEHEQPDTPRQCNPVITEKDFEGLAGDLAQGASNSVVETHALIEEEFVEPISEDTYFLFIKDRKESKNCLVGKLYPSKPGILVHNKPLLNTQWKFRIYEVLETNWEGYDEDFHCVGTFVAWDIENTRICKQAEKDKGKKRKRKDESEEEEKEQEEAEEVITEEKNERKTKEKIKTTKKTQKQRKIRNVTKVAVGKKAADRRRKKNEEKEEEIEFDYEEEEVEETIPESEAEKKRKEEETVWKMGGWKVSPKVHTKYGPKILGEMGDLFEDDSFIDYFLMFLPTRYIKEVVLPATNKLAKQQDSDYVDFSYDEFINIIGLIYMMEVIQLPERRLYWSEDSDGLFPAFNFGRIMPLHRFEEFLNFWQLSEEDDVNQQLLSFIDVVNETLKEAIQPGETLCIDESMIKAYHRNLAGKMKIIRKPRPIGNELKTVSDGRSNIVVHMELHEAKEDMANKDYVSDFGATTACCLRITESYKGSGRIIIGDSWFGSVKSCVQLYNINGLHSIMLVKTAHKKFPRFMLRDTTISRGEWVSATTEVDGVKLLAVRFVDLQEKMFISSTSTTLAGPPRKTKHHGDVARPQVAFEYLDSSASIDIHNHFRTGSRGLEDVWKTKNPIHRQVAGVLGFLFTNAYLTKRYFQKSNLKHYQFKLKLANKMTTYTEAQRRMRRLTVGVPAPVDPAAVHIPMLLKEDIRHQKLCWYCQHNPAKAPVRIKTSYYCESCGKTKPICHPSTDRCCFKQHIIQGMPEKRRYHPKK